MNVSYAWLQTYFKEPLGEPERIAELLTLHSFEVESLEARENDMLFSIDVLPNRAHDCLSHAGVARELAVLLGGVKLKNDPFEEAYSLEPKSKLLSVSLGEESDTTRYCGAVITGVAVRPSPEWLVKRLEAIGQRPINNVVDATNFVMQSIGQPLHAFDVDELAFNDGYAISVRRAKDGEKIETLDGEERALADTDIVIADGTSDVSLGIAGIKGGTAAEIREGTTRIILEAANFSRRRIRSTSRRLNLRTDASVRFDNGLSAELAGYGLREAVRLILDIAGGEVEGYVDAYPHPETKRSISVPLERVNSLLGVKLDAKAVGDILNRLNFTHTAKPKDGDMLFSVTVPFARLDLEIPQDLIEEIGRVLGYSSVDALLLPKSEKPPAVNKRVFYEEAIRDFLVNRGFSEVYTYTFQNKGVRRLRNPLAEDKQFLRTDLVRGAMDALELNAHYIDLLGLSDIRIFEIGKVFTGDGEKTELSVALYKREKKAKPGEELHGILKDLSEELNVDLLAAAREEAGVAGKGALIVDLDAALKNAPVPDEYKPLAMPEKKSVFKPISPYPFLLRDIAVWVPKETSKEELLGVIKEGAGELLKSTRLFDEYEKEGKVSYAYRLAFVSDKKTLTDEEVNALMNRITQVLQSRNWTVR